MERLLGKWRSRTGRTAPAECLFIYPSLFSHVCASFKPFFAQCAACPDSPRGGRGGRKADPDVSSRSRHTRIMERTTELRDSFTGEIACTGSFLTRCILCSSLPACCWPCGHSGECAR